MEITYKIDTIGEPITSFCENMKIIDVWHYYNRPMTFIFTLDDSGQLFYADLIQSFKSNHELWIITMYEGSYDSIVFEDNTHMRKAMNAYNKNLAHRILIVDNNEDKGLIIRDKAYVAGSYPHSAFTELYDFQLKN